MPRKKIEDLGPKHLQLARRIMHAQNGSIRRYDLDESERHLLTGLYSAGFVSTFLGRTKLTSNGHEMLEAIDGGDVAEVS